MTGPRIPNISDLNLGAEDNQRIKEIWFRFFFDLSKQLPMDISSGTGSPEGVVTANIGDVYINKSGGAGTTLYVKESGNGTNTGWAGK